MLPPAQQLVKHFYQLYVCAVNASQGRERKKGCVESVSALWDVIIFLLLSKYLQAVTESNASLQRMKMNSFNSNKH